MATVAPIADECPLAQDPLAHLLARADFVHLMAVHEEKGQLLYRISYRIEGQMHCRVALTLSHLFAGIVRGAACKTCTRCGKTKPLEEFPRAPVKKDRPEGRHSHCKLCDRERKRGKYLRSQRFKVVGEPAAPGPGAEPQSPR